MLIPPPPPLVAILDAHVLWLAGHGGGRADLTGQNLSRMDLHGRDLRQAILAHAHLEGACLRQAHLEQAVLTDAILQPAVLPGGTLQPADLAQAHLEEADLMRALLDHADLEAATLDGANLGAANLQGARLVRARLVNAHLQGAVLWEANLEAALLQNADLTGARLEGALLPEAQLQGSLLVDPDLRDTDLWGASLGGVSLGAARLTAANLRAADLGGVDLQQVTGLVEAALGGADLEGAQFPDGLGKYEGLANVAEAAKSAGKMFVALLTACAYSGVVIATTTDAALITNSGSAKLPLLDIPIPVDLFYVVAPAVLAAFALYFHLYLQRLWELLADLPAVFDDGSPLDKRAYPWAMNGLIHAYMPRLENRTHPPLMPLQNQLSRIFAWWLVPIFLTLFWAIYLRAHNLWVTEEHVFLLAIAVGMSFYYRYLIHPTLRGCGEPNSDMSEGNRRWLDQRRGGLRCQLVETGIGALLLGILSALAIQHPACRGWRMLAILDLRDAEVSTKPATWSGKAELGVQRHGALPEEEIALIKRAYLKGKDLSDALASRAFLIHADLRDASLAGATLDEANLREANLKGARLPRTILWSADLQSADLRNADLRGAELYRADLRGADLQGARLGGRPGSAPDGTPKPDLLQAVLYDSHTRWPDGFVVEQHPALRVEPETDLRGKDLQGLDLRDADLRGAHLEGADLRGANLRDVNLEGLPGAQAGPPAAKRPDPQAPAVSGNPPAPDFLKGALYDPRTRWPDDFRIKPHALLLIAPGRNLTKINLQRRNLAAADLRKAILSQANLRGAGLAGARLTGANLQAVQLSGADLRGADLRRADLRRANLAGASHLRAAQLQGAQYNAATRWPKGFHPDAPPYGLKRTQ